MNENYEYYGESALSFKKIMKYLVKAAPTIIISVILIVTIGLISVGIINNKDASYMATTSFELTYDGADKGLNMDGSLLDIQSVKSISNVSKAMVNLNLVNVGEGSSAFKYSASEISQSIKVTANYSQEIQTLFDGAKNTDELMKLLSTTNIKPSAFTFNLNINSIKGLEKADAENILKELIVIYRSNMRQYADSPHLLFQKPENMTVEQYKNNLFQDKNNLQFTSAVLSQLNLLQNYFDLNSYGIKFASERVLFNHLMNNIKALEQSVLQTGALKNEVITMEEYKKEIGHVITLLEAEKTVLTAQETSATAKSASILQAIEHYNPTYIIVNTDGNIQIINPDGSNVSSLYYDLMDDYVGFLNEADALRAVITSVETRIKALQAASTSAVITNTEEIIAKVNKDANMLFADVISLLENVNTTYNEFINRELSLSVNIIVDAITVKVPSNNLSVVLMLIICVVGGVVVGTGAYAIIEKVVIKKRKRLSLTIGSGGKPGDDLDGNNNINKN